MNPVLTVSLVLLTSSAFAQPKRDLELRINPEQVTDGIPQAFSFILTNRSDHDVRLPVPAINCASSYAGSVFLEIRFIPVRENRLAIGHGCASDKLHWPSLIERVTEWKIISPGETLTLTGSKQELFLDFEKSGRYELWANYDPPVTSTEDQNKLRAAGIYEPIEKLTSEHLTFEKN